MKRKLVWVLVMMVAMVLVFGTAPAMAKATKKQIAAVKAEMKVFNDRIAAARARGKEAGKRNTAAQAGMMAAQADVKKYDADEKAAAAGAAQAAKISADAAARQDTVCTVVGIVPVVGLAMRLYNSGEMKATARNIATLRATGKSGTESESFAGVTHAFFKLPAALPEHAAFDFLWRFTGANWRELDPVTVFLVDGRPYWMDAVVTGTKIFFGLAGAGVIHGAGHVHHAHHLHHAHHAHNLILPVLGGHTGPVGQAFLWTAAGGGSLNLLTGAASQFIQPSYKKYFNQLDWWNSRKPL